MSIALRGWLTEPHPGRGVHMLAEDASGWEFREYAELAASARRVAAALQQEGVRPGDIVGVLMPTGFPCLSVFFGVWAAGATTCMITPPAFDKGEEYIAGTAGILAQAEPVLLATVPEFESLAVEAMRKAGLPGSPWTWREAEDEAEVAEPGELALVQFTSGSSAAPRGVRVGWDSLAANIDLIRNWLGWRDGDVTATWLPLYHDMGLIGCLLTPVASQGDLWVMRPAQFVRDPGRWLECLTFAAHTAAPPFAFEYAARRVPPERFAGLDLSGWRNAIVGAEPVDPVVLERFAQLAEPAGFSRTAYIPAYGLAEATLAVTGRAGRRVPRVVRPDPGSLAFGGEVRVVEEYALGDVADPARPGWLTSAGAPGKEVDIDIVDDGGRALPAAHLGEIVVAGASVADGYHAGASGGSARFEAGRLHTGDAGFLYDGELFVLGRMGDSLKTRGRSVYVEDLEAAVVDATGLPRSRCAVVSMTGAGTTGVVLFAETAAGPWVDEARRVLCAGLGESADIAVVTGRPGLISRTTSGKVRRRHMWDRFRSGQFETVSETTGS